MQCSSPLRISITVAAVAVSVVTAATVHANSVHEVNQVGVTFDPREITVEPGDTVRWNWTSGFEQFKKLWMNIFFLVFENETKFGVRKHIANPKLFCCIFRKWEHTVVIFGSPNAMVAIPQP